MSPRRPDRYDRLAANVRRLAAEVRRAQPAPPGQQPQTAWEQQTESRLRAIEQQLANQNRLLLVAIVTVTGDIVLGLTR
jgi:hypothetical protein